MSILAKMAGLCWALFGLGLSPGAFAQNAPAIPEVIHFSGRVLCATGPLEGVRIEAIDSEGGAKELLSHHQELEAARREAAAKTLGIAVHTDREGRWTLSLPTKGVRLGGLGFRVLSTTHASVLLFPCGELFGNEWVTEDIHLIPGVRIGGFAQRVDGQDINEVRGRLLCHESLQELLHGTDNSGRQRVIVSRFSPIQIEQDGAFQTDWALCTNRDRSSNWTFESDENWASQFGSFEVHPKFPNAQQHLRLVRTRPVVLQGLVKSHEGNPLRGVKIELLRGLTDLMSWSAGTTTSKEDGTFQIEGPIDDLSFYRISARCEGFVQRSEALRSGQSLTSAEALEVVMLPNESKVQIIARREDEGTELSRFTTRVRKEEWGRTWHHYVNWQEQSWRRSLSDTLSVEILPAEEDLAETTPVVLPAFELINELTILVPRRVRRDLVLLDFEGVPVANARVQVVLPWPPEAAASERETWQPDRAWPKNSLLRKTLTTDEAGRAAIDGARGARLELQIEARGIRRQLISGVLMEEGAAPFVARVERLTPAAVKGQIGINLLRNTVQAEPGQPLPPDEQRGLVLIQAGDSAEPLHWPEEGLIPLSEEGAFACEGVPPGRWRLELRRLGGFSEGFPREGVSLTDAFEIRSGETLNLDLRDGIPHDVKLAEVKARILINGKPADFFSAKWYGRANSRRQSTVIETNSMPKPNHQIVRAQLPPGDYHLRIFLFSLAHLIWGEMGEPIPQTTLATLITVEAGIPRDLVFSVKIHRDLALRLIRPNTSLPVSNVMMLVRTGPTDPGIWLGLTSTAGVIDLPELTEGRHEILLFSRAKALTLNPIWSACVLSDRFEILGGRLAWSKEEKDLIKIGEIDVTRSRQLFEIALPASLGWW